MHNIQPKFILAEHRVVTGNSDISIVYRKEIFPMELSILLSIAAIYMALVGLGFIFAPQAIGGDGANAERRQTA